MERLNHMIKSTQLGSSRTKIQIQVTEFHSPSFFFFLIILLTFFHILEILHSTLPLLGNERASYLSGNTNRSQKVMPWTSEVVQWLRIHLPMQRTWVQLPVRKDPICLGVTNPMCHEYWAHAVKPTSCSYWSPCAPEPMLCNKRHYHNEKPPHSN